MDADEQCPRQPSRTTRGINTRYIENTTLCQLDDEASLEYLSSRTFKSFQSVQYYLQWYGVVEYVVVFFPLVHVNAEVSSEEASSTKNGTINATPGKRKLEHFDSTKSVANLCRALWSKFEYSDLNTQGLHDQKRGRVGGTVIK